MVETTTLPLEAVILDDSLQVRAKLDEGTVKRYAAAYDNDEEMPPVRVGRRGDGYILLDGWHRYKALQSIGASDLEAEILEGLEWDDMRWEAAKANLKHGLPLKIQEIREVFRSYVKAGKYRKGRSLKSYREIAKDLGGLRQHTTIRNWMQKDFPRIAKQFGGGHYGQGGDHKHYGCDPDYRFASQVEERLYDAVASFKAISDPAYKKDLLELAEKTLSAMKAEGPIERDEDNDDF